MRGPGGGRIHARPVSPSAGVPYCRRWPAPPIGMFPMPPFEIPDRRRALERRATDARRAALLKTERCSPTSPPPATAQPHDRVAASSL